MSHAVTAAGLVRRVPPQQTKEIHNVTAIAVVIALSYALKRHYSLAGPEELRWILAPTTALLEGVTGTALVFEPHVGYVSRELALAVVPACAGVNYLIIAFAMLSLSFLTAHASAAAKARWLVTSAVAAFSATIVVNAVRIGLGVLLRRHPIDAALVSPEQVHRVEGVVVYLTSLFLLFAVADAALRWRRA